MWHREREDKDMKNRNLIIVLRAIGGSKRAVAIQHDSSDDLMLLQSVEMNQETEDEDEVYEVDDEIIAGKAVKAFNTDTSRSMSEIIAGLEVYQRLEYVREDTSKETEKLAHMDRDTLDMLEKMTDDLTLRLAWYRGLMKDLLGDGAYACDMMQVEHHFGQITQDLFDAFAGLVEGGC